MRFVGVRCTKHLTIVAALALATVIGACGPSTPPNVRGQQRGSATGIGGILEDEKFKEIEPVLPSLPREASLIEFLPRRDTGNRCYIDRDSVSVGSDRVVRYTAVIKSASGAVNTSYEGIHCKTVEYKVFAFGTEAGTWVGAHDSRWQAVKRLDSEYRYALFKDYFCDGGAVNGRNAKDLVAKMIVNPLNNAADKFR